MGTRNEIFACGGFYHVYNRGVDGRVVFSNKWEFDRFLSLLVFCNSTVNLGHYRDLDDELVARSVFLPQHPEGSRLVKIHAFSLLPNHFHLVLEQIEDQGVSRFMQKLGTAWTNYFNKAHERSGGLFQGKFKAKHIDTEAYLFRVMAYVADNPTVHGLDDAERYRLSRPYYFAEQYAWLDTDWVQDHFVSQGQWDQYCFETNRETHVLRIQEAEIVRYLLE